MFTFCLLPRNSPTDLIVVFFQVNRVDWELGQIHFHDLQWASPVISIYSPESKTALSHTINRKSIVRSKTDFIENVMHFIST